MYDNTPWGWNFIFSRDETVRLYDFFRQIKYFHFKFKRFFFRNPTNFSIPIGSEEIIIYLKINIFTEKKKKRFRLIQVYLLYRNIKYIKTYSFANNVILYKTRLLFYCTH